MFLTHLYHSRRNLLSNQSPQFAALSSSVADPEGVDADPDPNFEDDADPDQKFVSTGREKNFKSSFCSSP